MAEGGLECSEVCHVDICIAFEVGMLAPTRISDFWSHHASCEDGEVVEVNVTVLIEVSGNGQADRSSVKEHLRVAGQVPSLKINGVNAGLLVSAVPVSSDNKKRRKRQISAGLVTARCPPEVLERSKNTGSSASKDCSTGMPREIDAAACELPRQAC